MTRRRFAKGDGPASGSLSPTSSTTAGNTSYGSGPAYGSYQETDPNVTQGFGNQKQVYQPSSAQSYGSSTQAPPSYSTSEHCTALYDYQAQQAGDLTIRQGDQIEILDRVTDPTGWWLGRLNGVEGNFPANYVQL